jgi:hypothetical protein
MGSKRLADLRIVRNHPFCAVCGSHDDLLVDRGAAQASHMVVSTVTGTVHDVESSKAVPRVLCAACHARQQLADVS